MASRAVHEHRDPVVPESAGDDTATTADAATSNHPSLLFFYSETSGASRRADGYLAQVLQRRSNHTTFRLVRIDANQRPDLLDRLQIRELPTILVIADKRIRARLVKPSGCEEIKHLLSPWLK
jgi:thioredoxin-like negative regulator of GroEL